jgi:hypothetical protein
MNGREGRNVIVSFSLERNREDRQIVMLVGREKRDKKRV